MQVFSQNNLEPKIVKSSNPKVGLIALSTDFTVEQDFRKICKDLKVDIFVNKIPFENPLNNENYLKMSNFLPEIANNILPGEKIDSIAYACTSGTVAIGEDIVTNQIRKTKPNVYVSTPITASIKSFSKMNIKKIAVLTPYPREVNLTVFNYLKQNNIEIDSFNSFNLNYDYEIAQVSLDSMMNQISKINLSNIDGLFVSCTALKIVDIIGNIEKEFKTNVVSSNQAIIWDCLKLLKIKNEVLGYGNLFRC